MKHHEDLHSHHPISTRRNRYSYTRSSWYRCRHEEQWSRKYCTCRSRNPRFVGRLSQIQVLQIQAKEEEEMLLQVEVVQEMLQEKTEVLQGVEVGLLQEVQILQEEGLLLVQMQEEVLLLSLLLDCAVLSSCPFIASLCFCFDLCHRLF